MSVVLVRVGHTVVLVREQHRFCAAFIDKNSITVMAQHANSIALKNTSPAKRLPDAEFAAAPVCKNLHSDVESFCAPSHFALYVSRNREIDLPTLFGPRRIVHRFRIAQ